MRRRKKRQQREEVRRMLAAIREELAAQRMAYEILESEPVTRLNELIAGARKKVG